MASDDNAQVPCPISTNLGLNERNNGSITGPYHVYSHTPPAGAGLDFEVWQMKRSRNIYEGQPREREPVETTTASHPLSSVLILA
jgi:hypothetical protein